jgi:Protein of unknown function (DUF2786)
VTATIWRICPSCGAGFEQPDDPGRKRVYCSRACQQAAYRARQRTSAGQRHSSGGQRTGRQDRRQDWRSERHEQRRQRPGSERPGTGQRHHQRGQQHQQRRPPPHSANGQRPGAGSGDDLARIRRIIAALLRKAAATSYPHEAAACREKAEALRVKYGL